MNTQRGHLHWQHEAGHWITVVKRKKVLNVLGYDAKKSARHPYVSNWTKLSVSVSVRLSLKLKLDDQKFAEQLITRPRNLFAERVFYVNLSNKATQCWYIDTFYSADPLSFSWYSILYHIITLLTHLSVHHNLSTNRLLVNHQLALQFQAFPCLLTVKYV